MPASGMKKSRPVSARVDPKPGSWRRCPCKPNSTPNNISAYLSSPFRIREGKGRIQNLSPFAAARPVSGVGSKEWAGCELNVLADRKQFNTTFGCAHPLRTGRAFNEKRIMVIPRHTPSYIRKSTILDLNASHLREDAAHFNLSHCLYNYLEFVLHTRSAAWQAALSTSEKNLPLIRMVQSPDGMVSSNLLK